MPKFDFDTGKYTTEQEDTGPIDDALNDIYSNDPRKPMAEEIVSLRAELAKAKAEAKRYQEGLRGVLRFLPEHSVGRKFVQSVLKGE